MVSVPRRAVGCFGGGRCPRRGGVRGPRASCCPIRCRAWRSTGSSWPRGQPGRRPHRPGTREYLFCERGRLGLSTGGERLELEAGDVAVFQGDRPHAYANRGTQPAVGFSVVAFVPGWADRGWADRGRGYDC
ncbi:MAG: cupin domain-containing protein [bacterium]